MQSYERVAREVANEGFDAMTKHGPLKSPHDGHSVIEEEYDEFWDAIKADDIPQAVIEARHLAAMAIKFILAYG